MQLEFFLGHQRQPALAENQLLVRGQPVPLFVVRNRRARRYVLRLRPDGAARVTIPRGGSVAQARQFAEKNVYWIEKQLLRQAAQPVASKAWRAGTEIFFRGERVRLRVETSERGLEIYLGQEAFHVADLTGDLRPALERQLWKLAAHELPSRGIEFATVHQLSVRRIQVRNQRSRWGSCSRHGTISLNWRLIQAPPFVRDYIVLHELAHLKEMNHSPRFWREVARLCPEFATAEGWLKKHSKLLL